MKTKQTFAELMQHLLDENRTLHYDEPGDNGENVHVSRTARECVQYMRSFVKDPDQYTDIELLDDYVVTNWVPL